MSTILPHEDTIGFENTISMISADYNEETKRYMIRAIQRGAIWDKKKKQYESMYPFYRIFGPRHEYLSIIQEKLRTDPMFLKFNPHLQCTK